MSPDIVLRIGSSKVGTAIAAFPTILLADDNPSMLETIVDILGKKYTVVAALQNGASVLDQIDALRPDLAILDVSLGDMSGFEVARRLRDRGCTAKIMFLTVHEAIDFVSEAFNIGVSGYVFKARVAEDLTKAIDVVINGGRFTSSTSLSSR
jgi:DNA-binding NarL/FixJ family response regulator